MLRLTDAFGSLRPEDVPPAGLMAARDALAAFEGVAATNVSLTCGATAALTAVLTVLRIRSGRNVLLCPRPHFPGYPALATLCGFEVAYYPAQGRYDVTAWIAELREAIRRHQAACVLLNSPHNPTGEVLSRRSVRTLARGARAEGCELVLDEAFAGICRKAAPRMGLVPGLVRVGSFNKRFPGMADHRLGYALAEAGRIADIALTHRTLSLAASLAAQHALCELLADDPAARLAQLSVEIQEHLRLATRLLRASPHLRPARPQAGFFLLVSLPPGSDAALFSRSLNESTGVWCAAAPSFGVTGESWIRLRLGVPRRDLEQHCLAVVAHARRIFDPPGDVAAPRHSLGATPSGRRRRTDPAAAGSGASAESDQP